MLEPRTMYMRADDGITLHYQFLGYALPSVSLDGGPGNCSWYWYGSIRLDGLEFEVVDIHRAVLA